MASTNILDQLTTDLTMLAQQGKLDPVVGRDAEIDQLIKILSHPENNAAVLVGDRDTGITAIIEAAAQRIADGLVPDKLLNKHIRQLDIGSLAHIAQRGSEGLKEVIGRLIHALSQSDSIVFIDELFVANPNMRDFYKNLEDFLQRTRQDNSPCIIEMTAPEFKVTENDNPALARQFQILHIDEPSFEIAIRMIQSAKSVYETFHHIQITDEAIEASVRLSAKFVHDRKLPGKALDLIDETAARLRMSAKVESNEQVVTVQNIAETIVLWTGCPLNEILKDDSV